VGEQGIDWLTSGIRNTVAIGECMIELARNPDGMLQERFAGDTLNAALYLKRLLPSDGREVYYVTGLGMDPMSNALRSAWEAEGLRTELLYLDRKRLPGLYLIDTDSRGERSFYYWRGESAARRMMSPAHASLLLQHTQDFQLVYLSGITLAILAAARRARLVEVLHGLKRAGAIVVFDSNYRAPLWSSRREAAESYTEVLGIADVVLSSFDDERAVFSDPDPAAACRRLAAEGVREVVVTDGTSPCTCLYGARLDTVEIPRAVMPLDTTAAGDSFNAAYLAARLAGRSTRAAVVAGQALAGRVIMHRGAIMPRAETPTLAELA